MTMPSPTSPAREHLSGFAARAMGPHAGPMASGGRELLKAVAWGWVVAAPFLAFGGWDVYRGWRTKENARLAAIEAALAHEKLVAAPAGPMLTTDAAIHGRELFASICAACHGPQGKGVENLGKNLAESDFVAQQTDDQLREFVAAGRPAAKPMPMPPKGGRPELTDDDLRHLVTYVRGLQDPRRMPELPPLVMSVTPTEEQGAAALAAAGGDTELAGYIASGDKLFHSTCIACHGKAGAGIPGNGKTLANNEFIASLDDDKLLAFIQQGRGPSDPKNTTGIQMPPKGGNPALSEDDILDIIAYLRTLQPKKPAAAPGK